MKKIFETLFDNGIATAGLYFGLGIAFGLTTLGSAVQAGLVYFSNGTN
jgi:F0F1-type ATP synthase membrane subunit c/vacuolar-type H+-ATPase subunit K